MDEKKRLEKSDSAEILIKEVLEEADAEVEEIIEDAENKSRIMIEDAKKKLIAEIKTMFDDIDEKIDKEREDKLAEVQSQIKKEILEIKEEKINLVLAKIENELTQFINSSEYISFLEKILQKILPYLDSDHTYLIHLNKADLNKISQADVDRVGQKHKITLKMNKKEHIDEHGMLITSEDRKMMFQDTVEARFEQKREEIRSKIAKILFKA